MSLESSIENRLKDTSLSPHLREFLEDLLKAQRATLARRLQPAPAPQCAPSNKPSARALSRKPPA